MWGLAIASGKKPFKCINAEGNGQNITLHLHFKTYPSCPTGKDICAFHLQPASRSFHCNHATAANHEAPPPCPTRCACDLSWANRSHFKGMIGTWEGGLSPPLRSRPRRTIMPGPFFLLYRGHLRPNPEKREIKGRYGLSPGSSHTSNPCASQAGEPNNLSFCCNVIEFANKIIITNTPNWRFTSKNHISPNHPHSLAHLTKLRRVLD